MKTPERLTAQQVYGTYETHIRECVFNDIVKQMKLISIITVSGIESYYQITIGIYDKPYNKVVIQTADLSLAVEEYNNIKHKLI